ITDNPHIWSHDKLLILDPHARVEAYPGGLELSTTRPPEDPKNDRDTYPGHFTPFSAIIKPTDNVYQGTAIRLPLRLPNSGSTVKNTPTTIESARQMFRDFIAKELPESMLFLKHITTIELKEIDEEGMVTVLATAKIENADAVAVQRSRNRGREEEMTHYRLTTTVQLHSEPVSKREWIITHFVEKYQVASAHMTNRLGRNIDEVKADMSTDKLLPHVALALPIPEEGATSVPGFHGRLFTLLPLPIITGFPLHINAVLALTSSRQNLRNAQDVVAATREEFLVEWNRVIFSEFVPKAWASLMDYVVTHDRTTNVFDIWPAPVATRDGDPGYWYPLPSRLLEEAAGKAVWPLSEKKFALLGEVLIASEGETGAPLSALEACHVPLVLAPSRVLELVKASSFKTRLLSPETAQPYIKKNPNILSDLDAKTLKSICDYLASANDLNLLLNLPIIPNVEGEYTSIHTHATYTMVNSPEAFVFGTVDRELLAADSMSPKTRKVLLSHSAGLIRELEPANVARYLHKQVGAFGGTKLANVMNGVSSATVEWLIKFWTWLDGWEKLNALVNDAASWSAVQKLHALPLRSESDKLVLRLVEKSAVRHVGTDPEVVSGLVALDVPVLHGSLPNGPALQRVSRPSTDVVFILQNVAKNKPFSGALDDQEARRTLHEFFTTQLASYLRPKARHLPRPSLDSECRKSLRRIPIFPVLNAGVRGAESVTFDDAPEGACFVDESVKVVPSIRGTPFVDHGQSRTLYAALEGTIVESEVSVLRRAIEREAWSQQDQVPGLLVALVDRLIRRLNEVDKVMLERIGELPIVEVGGRTGRLNPKQVVDPISELAGLYDTEDEVLPVGQFAKEGTGTYIHQLRSYRMLRNALNPATITERVTRIADPTKTMKGREEKALRLLRLLDSYVRPRGAELSPEIVRILRSSAWIPVGGAFYRPSECWDHRSTETFLCDMVLPRISFTIGSLQLRENLGWTKVPFETLRRQFLAVLDADPNRSATSRMDDSDRVELVLRELALGLKTSRVLEEQIELLVEALGDSDWVPTSRGTRVQARRSMLEIVYLGSKFHPVSSALLQFAGMEELLGIMGIPKRPSMNSMYAALQEVSNELSEQGIKVHERDHLIRTSIAILEEINRNRDSIEFDPHQLLIPTESFTLAPALTVLFNDMGDASPTPQPGLAFAHPSLSQALAYTLGLRKISEEEFARDEDDIDAFHIAEDLTARIQSVLMEYDMDHSSNEWIANADDAKARSFTFLIDEARFEGRRVLGGLTEFQSGPALVIHNDGVFTEKDFQGLGNIGRGGKADETDSIGRFGLGALSFYHFSETIFRFPLRTALQAAESKLSKHSFSALDASEVVNRFYSNASQSLFFTKSVTSIAAIRRSPDLNIHSTWSITASRNRMTIGEEGTTTATTLDLVLASPNATGSQSEKWMITESRMDSESFPPTFHTLFPRYRLPSPTFGIAMNVSAKDTIKESRLFATLPLPISISLPIHIHATWIVAQDRRSIRCDAPDAGGHRTMDSQYNQHILENVIPNLYLRSLAIIARHYPKLIRNFWPRKPQDGLSRMVATSVYKQLISSTEPVLLTVENQPIAPVDAIVHFWHLSPAAVRKILTELKIPNYVPSPHFDTGFLDDWGSLRRDSPAEVAQVLRDGASMVQRLWRSNQQFPSKFNSDDVLSILEYLMKDKEPLEGVPLLPREDGQLSIFQSPDHRSVFASHKSDIADLFGRSVVVSSAVPELVVQKMAQCGVNVKELDAGGMRELLQHHNDPITPSREKATTDAQIDWHKNLLLFLAQPTPPVKIEELSNLPLLPTVGGDSVISRDYALENRVWWRSVLEDISFTRVILQLGITSVNLLPGTLEKTDPITLPRILGLLSRFDHNLQQIHEQVDEGGWASFARYLKTWIEPHPLSQLSSPHFSTLVNLPIFEGQRGPDRLPFVSASQVLVLPTGISLQGIAQYLPDNTIFAMPSMELTAILRRGNNHERALSFDNLLHRLQIPEQLAEGTENEYLGLLQLVTAHHGHPYQGRLIPDMNRDMQRPDHLYDHRVELFTVAFDGRPDLFIHPTFRHIVDNLRHLGLQHDVTPQRLLQCVRAVDSDARRGIEVGRRATWMWDYVNDAPQPIREVDFNELRALRFIPRHVQRHPANPDFDRHASDLPAVVSLDELYIPERMSIAWTQRASFVATPTAIIRAVFPELGEPTPPDVVRHLVQLATQVAPAHPQSSLVFSEIRRVYDWLQSNKKDTSGLLQSLSGQSLWLNVDSDSDTWTWRSAEELVFDLQYDGGQHFDVRNFLMRYRSLLVDVGAREYRYAELPSAATSTANVPHPEKVRRGEFQEGDVVAVNGVLPEYPLPPAAGTTAFAIKSVLDFVYTGAFTRPSCTTSEEAATALEDLLNLLELSNIWDIPELKVQAVTSIVELRLIRVETCDSVLERAEACQAQDLAQKSCLMEDLQRRRARAQAVDEEYEKLEKFHIDRRRIVFVDSDYTMRGGYGVVQKAELYESAYLPTWIVAHPPQKVVVKQIKMPPAGFTPDLKSAFTKEILVYDTIDALNFLHNLEPPVCHGDIKSANVLVGADFRARLCDFGLARLLEDNGFERLETSTGFKGSIRWCSPEVLDGQPRSSTSDVYSWAWLVWEIMTGELPYAGTNAEYSIIRQIFESPRPQVNGEARLSDCLQLWELMTRCWEVNPPERPTASMCQTAVAYLPHCTPSAPSNDGERSPRLLETLGDLEGWKGNTPESLSYLNEALKRYEEEANAKGVASVLEKQAATLYRASNYRATFTAATAALDAYKALGDPRGVTQASFWLSASLRMQGKESEALPLLREAFEGYQAQKNDIWAARCLMAIGEIQRLQKQVQEALITVDQAMAITLRSGDRLGASRALGIIARAHQDLGDLTQAAAVISEASTIARKIGWDLGLSDGLVIMANIKVKEGQYQQAEELYREAIPVARRSNERWCLAYLLDSFGWCLEIQSKISQATPLLREAWQLYQDMGREDIARPIASRLATLEGDQCKWDAALFWKNRVIAGYRYQKRREDIAWCLEDKVAILRKAGRYDEAALHLEAAIVIWEEEGYHDFWTSSRLRDLITLPKTLAKWERPLLCDVKRLQRRDEQYEKLRRFQVGRRRIVPVENNPTRAGGYGIVQKAELHESPYLPSWLAMRRYGPPQIVAVKQIRIPLGGFTPDLKRAFTKEILIWSSLEEHPGIAKFLGFYADFKRSEAWLLSPWEPNGNISEFVAKRKLEIPEKLGLIMTGELPYADTNADFSIIRQIFESPRPQVNGEARLSDCLQVWELMTRCWEVKPLERPTTSMCKTTVEYLPHCTPSAPTNDGERSPQLLETLGDLENWKGNTSQSLSYLSEALTRYEKEGNAEGVASVLEKQAATLYQDSDFRATFIAATAALEAFKNLEDPRGITRASFWLACSLSMEGRDSEALPRFREAFDGYQTQKNDVGAVRCLAAIGDIQRRFHQNEAALTTLDQATTMAARSGDRLGVARALGIVACTHTDLGDLDRATETISDVCTIARSLGWDLGLSNGLGELADIKVKEGSYEAAEKLYQESISVARRGNGRWELAAWLQALAEYLRIQSKLAESEPMLEEAWRLYRDMEQQRWAAQVASSLGRLKGAQWRWNDALEWQDRVIMVYRSLKDQTELASSLEGKAAILRKAERYDEAALHLEAAIVIWEEEDVREVETSPVVRRQTTSAAVA
ncbi:hypothetical protein FRB90_005630, partial [Tulasnella sp. 427]